ncbi:hypothetical protein S245_012927, partial [Arachis hypogaea]
PLFSFSSCVAAVESGPAAVPAPTAPAPSQLVFIIALRRLCSTAVVCSSSVACAPLLPLPHLVIQAILSVEKQLQQLNIREEENNNLRSNLLSRLILTASSDSVIANATKMLSSLNKESADQGDLKNLIIASEAQFPEVTRAWKAFQMEEEQLNSLIGLYRKRLGMRNLEFMSVSGITHLIEAMQLLQNPEPSMKIQQIQQRSLAF